MSETQASRRAFLASMGIVSGWAATPWLKLDNAIAYVGGAESIGVYRTTQGRRIRIQSIASQCPSSLKLDRDRGRLFAANQIDQFRGLPMGSVESFAVDAENGHLTLISRRCLSLSATMPRSLAVDPKGEYLVVAIYGGGAYNVLPIGKDGELCGVTQIIKEIGSSIHPQRQTTAHPHSMVFHPSGKFVLGTDLGSDRINVFRFKAGRMERAQQMSTQPGSGPAQITIDRAGCSVSVRHELSLSLSRYRFDSDAGLLSPA